jgi:predicted transcriptional regulator
MDPSSSGYVGIALQPVCRIARIHEVTPPHLDCSCLRAGCCPLAKAAGHSKSWLINKALNSFVANERQILAAVDKGKKALREGSVVDHTTVVAAFERLIAPKP